MDTSSASLLAPLGVHGWERIEPLLLAGVLLGEPTLMISEPGSAKTFVGQVLARALSTEQEPLAFGYYDVSKANFEDIIGFPNPEAFRQGRSEFIHNQLTIWDKGIIMVDEVSRAARETSNKWLEVLGSRMLMGQPLPLRAVLAGMNPHGHAGTSHLDEAFADRFVLFIPLPTFVEMPAATREQILVGRTGLDAPSVGYWAQSDDAANSRQAVLEDEHFQRGAAQLREHLQRAGQLFATLDDAGVSLRVARYADLFARALTEAGVQLEARRLKMLARAILATYAVRLAGRTAVDTGTVDVDELTVAASMVSAHSLPHPYTASGVELSDEQLDAAHLQAAPALREDVSQLALFQSTSQAERLRLLLSRSYPPTVQEKVCADFLADDSLDADMTSWVLAQLLLAPQAASLPAHCLDKLSRRFRRCEEKLRRTTGVQLQANAQIAEQHEAYQQVAELIEEVERQAAQQAAPRIACAWALGQAEENPRRVLELYPEALQALQQAMRTLQPLCAEWGVDGAAEWSPLATT